MRRTMCSVVVAVPLVPLLVAELPALLILVLPQFLAISVHLALFLVMVAQALPLGSPVLSVRVFTPIAGATGIIAAAVGTVLSNRPIIICLWGRIIPLTTANSD